MPYTISKTFAFSYGHRLLKDAGKCARLHGHSAKATVFLSSQKLDSAGMVYHFDKLKDTLGNWIAENLDHRLLLQRGDPATKALKNVGEDFVLIDFAPTAENIAKWIFDEAKGMKLPVCRVELWESETSRASYEAQRGR